MTEKTPITQEMIATAVAVLAANQVQCAAPLAEVAAKILAIGAKGPKVRSPADHRRFFGCIKAAFMHWPEQHDFQPDDAEHLRAWLLCRAGYKTVTSLEFEDHWSDEMRSTLVELAESLIRDAKSHAFVRPMGNVLYVFWPRSLKFEELGQKEFGQIREVVEEVIKCETGREASELLRETGRAA
jgi:hypothetical protein